MTQNRKSVALFLSLSCLLFLFSSCKPDTVPRIELGDDFYYWPASPESTLGDAMAHAAEFKKLEDKSVHNLRNVLGRESQFVWVRAEFSVPPEFLGKPLGLVVPYLRFAEMLYCNGTFISMYGAFPPRELSTFYKAHFFNFPPNILDQTGGKNTILIKIYSKGKSGISSHSFIQPSQFAYSWFELINFHNARMYMFFEGTLIFTFLLFLCLYLNLRSFREYLDFALLNVATMFFIMPFFATEMPFYNDGVVPFLLFIKGTYCIPFFIFACLTGFFVEHFVTVRLSAAATMLRFAVTAAQIAIGVFAPSFEFLMNACPFLIALSCVHVACAAYVIVRGFQSPEKRRFSAQVLFGFSPIAVSAAIDIAIRFADNTQAYPYFSIFGWQFSILAFIIILSIRFARIYNKNEQLTNYLQDEVDKRTAELKVANAELSKLNERLEIDKYHSDMDLEMASSVQKRFLPQPDKHFKGWDISIFYLPQAKVSGDLYDYYSYNDVLNGLSLFDVSGHGMSASLVTMLSKNIISHAFLRGYRKKEEIDAILTNINNTIIYEKGEIENYMTGLLCRFEDSKDSDTCRVEIGNAGHPYPLRFSAKDNEVHEIRGNDGKKHFGAIGMKGIAVSFAKSTFAMEEGDILVCCTDGVTEASNRKQEQFGMENLKRIIKENAALSSGDLLKAITAKLSEFTAEKPLEDDITIIIARKTNPKDFVPEEQPEEILISPNEEGLEELDSAEE